MDKTPLVDRYLVAGQLVVEAMDQAGFPLTAALWQYSQETDDWDLCLASPVVGEKKNTLAAYAALREALKQTGNEYLYCSTSLVNPEQRLVWAVRLDAGTDPAPFIGGKALRHTVVGDIFVQDAYVYRAERILGLNGEFEHLAAIYDKSRREWAGRPCTVFVQEGLVQKIEGNGFTIRQRQTKQGLNARVRVFWNLCKKRDKIIGDVREMSIFDGRLRTMNLFATGVQIEPVSKTARTQIAS